MLSLTIMKQFIRKPQNVHAIFCYIHCKSCCDLVCSPQDPAVFPRCEESGMTRMRSQPFIAHSQTIDEDYRIFYYSDVHTQNLYAHMHDFFELYLLVSGKVVYKTGGIDFFLRQGDILFINKGQLHNPVLIEPDIPYERIALHISPETLAELSVAESSVDLAECFTRDNFVVYHYPQEVLSNIRRLLGRLFAIYEENIFAKKLLGRAYLTELFVEINQYNHNKDIYFFSKDTKNSQLVELVKHYTLTHLRERITIKMLADYLYISEHYFMHLFKKSTGIPAYQFLTQLRLQVADEAIRQGSSFAQASEMSGFRDYCNFYRAFQKRYGLSPRHYYHHQNILPPQADAPLPTDQRAAVADVLEEIM